MSYTYYDISNDDIPELLISVDYGNEYDNHIVDMFGYENGEVKRLFGLWSFGTRGGYKFYPNGIICSYGSGVAMYYGETYYSLEKDSVSPVVKSEFSIEYLDAGTKCYVVSEDNQCEITESEYNAFVSQFGEEVVLNWNKLCESKLYETEFSVRGDNGINQGYQQLFVTSETNDEMTVLYRQVGQDGYPVYVEFGSVFKVKKSGEVSNIKWTDKSGNEFTGTVSHHDNCFTLTFKTDSPDSAIKECTGVDLYLKDSNSTDTSSTISIPLTTVPTTASLAVNFTPDSLWAAFVNNEWFDEEGNRLKFTKNITCYKFKPNAVHTTYDYYMGTLSTTNSKGYYYGHYHIDDENKLILEFNSWPSGSSGLLLNESYVWDPTLQKKTVGVCIRTER